MAAAPHPRAAHAGAAGLPAQTPLRRISRGSLSALSASRTRRALDDYSQPALSHLAPVFAELSEAIEDLAVNFEGLDAINDGLDRFNEGLAGLLYGLRMNAYTSDILEVKLTFGFPSLLLLLTRPYHLSAIQTGTDKPQL